MTDAQKLEALVRRAIDNGWPWVIKPMPDAIICVMPADLKKESKGYLMRDLAWAPPFLYHHDFARALFGDDFDESKAQYIPFTGESEHPDDFADWYGKAHYDGPTYQYRLMMAVIAPNPIDYMYKAVFGE